MAKVLAKNRPRPTRPTPSRAASSAPVRSGPRRRSSEKKKTPFGRDIVIVGRVKNNTKRAAGDPPDTDETPPRIVPAPVRPFTGRRRPTRDLDKVVASSCPCRPGRVPVHGHVPGLLAIPSLKRKKLGKERAHDVAGGRGRSLSAPAPLRARRRFSSACSRRAVGRAVASGHQHRHWSVDSKNVHRFFTTWLVGSGHCGRFTLSVSLSAPLRRTASIGGGALKNGRRRRWGRAGGGYRR